MTPHEREMVEDLFQRLAALENRPRDPEAERAIAEGLSRAPHAVYALVQTALVQEEALRAANERIEELETQAEDGSDQGFLGNMRDTLFGSTDRGRGSVPSVPASPSSGSRWGPAATAAMRQQAPQEQQQQGGSFLGTAAAAAAGVIGGALLLNGIRSAMAQSPSAQGALGGGSGSSPWGEAGGGELARQAGIDDIGRGDAQRSADLQGADEFDTADLPDGDEFDVAELDDIDGDLGGDFGGGDLA
jgi:hypothetical protein